MRAVFNGVTVAESDETIELEGNHYFPPDSVDERYLERSRMKSLCFWKGVASYRHVSVDGSTAKYAALGVPPSQPAGPAHQGARRLLERRRGAAGLTRGLELGRVEIRRATSGA